MKTFCMLAVVSGLLNLACAGQTASGAASGNASVTPNQVNAGANARQNAQGAGTSANANASAQSQVNNEHRARNAKSGASGDGNTNGGAAGSSAALASGTKLNAELTHSLDAKSAKPGDQVTARLTEDVKSNNKVVMHRGSKLVGHVTEAQARGKDNADSRLGIVFDKAILKGGQEMTFSGTMQAVAPPANTALSAAADESETLGGAGTMGGGARRSSGGGGGGLLGGATSTATGVVAGTTGTVAGSTTGAVNGTVSGVTGAAGGLTAQGRLTSASQGALGLQGLTLNSAAAGSAQGSVISSTTRNVKLDSGTQMLLMVEGSAH